MKKTVAFFLILSYFFAMAGTTIAMHYCMGEKVSTTLGYEEQNTCEFCHMEKHSDEDSNKCCKDDHQFVKLNADQDLSSFATSPLVVITYLSSFLSAHHTLPAESLTKDIITQVVPPDLPVYQRNCNFRI